MLRVARDSFGQAAAQRGPVTGIGQPVPGDRRRMIGDAHGVQWAGPQQSVAAQQIGCGRHVRPVRQLSGGRRGGAAPGQPGRGHVEHGGADQRGPGTLGRLSPSRRADGQSPAGGTGWIAQQQAVPDVQRERVAKSEPRDGAAEQADPCRDASGADVHRKLPRRPSRVQPGRVRPAIRAGAAHLGGQPDIHHGGQRPLPRRHQRHAPRHCRPVSAAQVKGDPCYPADLVR